MSILPFSVKSFGLGQALVDEVNIPLRRGDAGLRFLLESVQYMVCRAKDCFGTMAKVSGNGQISRLPTLTKAQARRFILRRFLQLKLQKKITTFVGLTTPQLADILRPPISQVLAEMLALWGIKARHA